VEVFRRLRIEYHAAIERGLNEVQLYDYLEQALHLNANEVLHGRPTTANVTASGSLPRNITIVDLLKVPPQQLEASSPVKSNPPMAFVCPRVRFGRTEISMPIITCGRSSVYSREYVMLHLVILLAIGSFMIPDEMVHFTSITHSSGGMRMQQTWKPPEGFTLKDVIPECQKNFEDIVDRAMEYGINHFETARGYGCSELQYGLALKRHRREDMIIQTKVITP